MNKIIAFNYLLCLSLAILWLLAGNTTNCAIFTAASFIISSVGVKK